MGLCARGWDLLFCLFLPFHSAKSHPSFPFTSCFQRTHHYKASPALSPIKAKNHVTSLPGAVGRALYVSPRSRNVTKQEKQQSSHPLLSLFLWLFQYSARSRKQWINNRESKYYMRSPEPKRVGRCASTCLALSSSSWPVPIWQIPFTGRRLIRMYYLALPKEYKNKTHQLLPSFLVGREKRCTERREEKRQMEETKVIEGFCTPVIRKHYIIIWCFLPSALMALPPFPQAHLYPSRLHADPTLPCRCI